MTLFLYMLASFGAAFVLGYAKITLPLRSALSGYAEAYLHPAPLRFVARWLLMLLECPVCVAFWFGLASAFTPIVDFLPISAPAWALAPFLGLANTGAILSLGLLTGLIRPE